MRRSGNSEPVPVIDEPLVAMHMSRVKCRRRVSALRTILGWTILVPAALIAYLVLVRGQYKQLPLPWDGLPMSLLHYPAIALGESLTRRGVFVAGTLKNVPLMFGILIAWWAILGAGIGAVHHTIRRRRAARWRHRRPECVACGYDLRGLTEPRCPECGTPFDPGSFDADQLASRKPEA